MVKFNYEFRLNIVFEYLNGIGSTTLARMYGIADKNIILRWVSMYKAYGFKGLIVRNTNMVYSGEYKLKVLNWMHTHHKSYPETALHFNISAPSTIFTWQRRMETKGIIGLYTKRGRPKMNKTKIIESNKLNIDSYKYLIKYEYKKIQYNHENDSKINQVNMLIHKLPSLPKTYILSIIRYPRSVYYYQIKKAKLSDKNDQIKSLIKKIIDQHRGYGYRRVTATLKNDGIIINHKRVQKIMADNDWQCSLYTKKKSKYNSYKGQVGHIAPNLLNGKFNSALFGSKITTDVSEFRYGPEDIKHRVYLSPVLYLYSDKILSYSVSDHPTVEFTLKSLVSALESLRDLPYKTVVHSDQGVQYQSHRWVNTLNKYNALQSMSRKATCSDNAQMESFFHIMKAEMMDRHYDSKDKLIQAMKAWIKDYNENRIKEKLGYQLPNQYLGLAS
ncbi:IS3 family transposase [Lactobacillaceae bacterium Melli_B3]